jgi:putative transposase
MPRTSRIKTGDGLYHIMIRSISELDLFKEDSDKEKYLELIKKYEKLLLFKVYSYCFMTNHAHFIIDCCGADISKIMHNLNQSYALYLNRKYKRIGPVFADRFKSVPIKNKAQFLIVSAYIHNNAKDLGYEKHVEAYAFSSLGIILGTMKDKYNVLDYHYILSYYSGIQGNARRQYLDFVKSRMHLDIPEDMEFNDEKTEYESCRKILVRDFSPGEIVDFVTRYTGITSSINIKFNRKNHTLKCICVVLMRSLCNFSYKEICSVLGNICSSGVWRMCSNGLDIIQADYKNLITDLISESNGKVFDV